VPYVEDKRGKDTAFYILYFLFFSATEPGPGNTGMLVSGLREKSSITARTKLRKL